MYKTLTLLLLLTISLSANTPNMFKAVGDPIYNEIPAVKRLLKVSYFKKEKLVFKEFATQAQAHKRLGLSYDKKRKNKTLNKEEQKEYLKTLRELGKQLNHIHFIVHEALPSIIKKGDVNSFYQLKGSGLDVLHGNKRNVQMIKQYDQELKRQRKLDKMKQEERKEEARIAYHKMLRSAKNLNGEWHGKSSDSSKLLALFKAEELALSYITEEHTSILLGTYSIGKTFDFKITRRELVKSGNTHTRHIDLKRRYTLKKITGSELILQHKDETITLKRKR